MTHPDDIEASEELAGRLVEKGGGSDRLEKRYLNRSGHVIHAILSTSLVCDEQGRTLYFVSQIMDVTAKRTVEHLADSSERKYRQLIESANDAIFVADGETGTLVDCNKKAEDLVGRSRDEIIGMNQMGLHPRKEAENYAKVFQKYLGKGIGVVPGLEAQHSSGRRIPVEISSSIYELDGKTYMQGIFRDVTERRRLAESLQRGRELTDALVDIDLAVSSAMNRDEIMKAVVEASRVALRCESSAVVIVDGDNCVIEHTSGWIDKNNGEGFPLAEFRCGQRALTTDRPCSLVDPGSSGIDTALAARLGVESGLAVPLKARGVTPGLLLFLNHSERLLFDEEQVDFAAKLATSVSVALANYRHVSAQTDIADTLQEATLLLPEELEGVAYSHLYRSATETARVGGDFYDLIELDDDRLGITIGDISGKGLEAAALTSLVKNAIRAYSYEAEAPSKVLTQANRVMIDASRSSDFATVFFGILDRSDGKLIYSVAGHPPPLLSSGSTVTPLGIASTMLLGAFAEPRLVDESTRLKKGDTLFLYTDGFLESRGREGMFGEDRLAKTVGEASERSARDIPDVVLKSLESFTGGNLSDDLAAIAISLDRRKIPR